MANPNAENEKKAVAPASKAGAKKRRRRVRGVPGALVAVLVVCSLFLGGLFGYAAANRTNTYRQQLDSANARIAELENTMTMIGFSGQSDDADQWVFDDSGIEDEFNDMTGATPDNGDAFWGDEGLQSGMLDLGDSEPVVVAEFKGGTVMSNEVVEPYNNALAMQVFSYSDADDVSGDVLSQVLGELVADKVLYQHAEELGLTELSDEDKNEIQLTAQETYDQQREFYRTSVDTSGMTQEEADAAVEAYMKDEVGITLEGLVEENTKDYWIQKLFAKVCENVTVTDEALQAAYDSLLASQKELFESSSEEYEYAALVGDPIAYNLPGYRRVRHILLAFDSTETESQATDLTEQIALLDPEKDAEQIAALQAQLDALYTDLDAKAQEILDQLAAGTSFDDLLEQYGQDEAMMFEPTKTTGYYISNSSTQWASEFVEGCMMLEEPGQVSTPIHTVSGVHLIQYVADVPAGEVPLSEIQDALSEQVLEDLQEAAYNDQIAQWIADADAKYYPERLQ